MKTLTPGYTAALHTSRQHITQSAQVAHSPEGEITLSLTEAAADVLAKLLFDYDALTVTSPDEDRRSVDRYDADFWTQVATTLATQRVIALHGPTPAEIHAHTVLVPKVTLVGPVAGDLVDAVDLAERRALADHVTGACKTSEWSCSPCETGTPTGQLGDDTLAMIADQDAAVRSL